MRGEDVILALGARWPGGRVESGGRSWYQPPTAFHTMGVSEGWPGPSVRQHFSLDRLRAMVAEVPATDAVPAAEMSGSRLLLPLAIVLAGSMGFAYGYRRATRMC